MKKLTTEQFIERARQVHGDRFDYSLTEYVNRRTKVKIICPDHGVFEQQAGSHLYGKGCALCGRQRTTDKQSLNTPEFIEKAKAVHGCKYDYSQTQYSKSSEKVIIKCSEHGVFEQTPNNHLRGQGCPSCAPTCFDPKKPATLYCAALTAPDGTELIKIGVTRQTLKARLGSDLKDGEVIGTIEFGSGAHALIMEASMKKALADHRYQGEPFLVHGGDGELFQIDHQILKRASMPGSNVKTRSTAATEERATSSTIL